MKKQGRIHDCPCRGRLGRGSNELGRGSNELGRGIISMKYSYPNFSTFKQLKMQEKQSVIELTDKPIQ